MMQQYFYRLAAFFDQRMQGNEQYTCWFSAEATDFVRFNKSAIRQPGHVQQIYLTFKLIDGMRHADSTLALAGDIESDAPLLARMMEELRDCLPDLPDDPYLLFSSEVHSTERVIPSRLADSGAMVDQILSAAKGLDLVGILASGPVYRGFANSLGQRNWHEANSFNFDWSLYAGRDKAVKTTYAGLDWRAEEFSAKFASAASQLALLQRAPVSIEPGAYRAYFTPTALNEIVSMLNWSGISEKALRTHQSPLRRMRDDGRRLHSSVTISENMSTGLAPGFQSDGFIKPERVALIDRGELVGSLVSPRTAKEYAMETNSGSGEAMGSVDFAAGQLPVSRVLEELGTGVFISNLWYLNFSDRANFRMTGMTRFATFWVEDGEITAPLNVMRFDDSLYRMLGENLIGLTQERELLTDADSYGGRSTNSAVLPGALVKDFMFVL